jgi:hypothetical protein
MFVEQFRSTFPQEGKIMRILRVLFFVTTFLATSTSLAQGDTKVARDKLSSVTADPSPWDKEEESGLWHLERDALGDKWQMVMGVVGRTIHFTIMIPCENGFNEAYTWKHGDSLAIGTNCAGRKAGIGVTHLGKWIEPLPREVVRGSKKIQSAKR